MISQQKIYRPVTSGLRHRVALADSEFPGSWGGRRLRNLVKDLKKSPGRSRGKVTVRHKGGGAKRLYRFVDFKRDKFGIKARVATLEYDPNRNVNIALLHFSDGEKRYILAPQGLAVGAVVESGPKAPIRVGNALPLEKIPPGTLVHNLELAKGGGAKLVRSAGLSAQVLSREENGRYVQVKLPSGEVRRILSAGLATVGELGNAGQRHAKLGKAGRSRHIGIRPTVRGVAQNPKSHPHGGGEGRSGIGMPTPKTPWGKVAFGRKTRRRGNTDKYIVSRRKSG